MVQKTKTPRHFLPILFTPFFSLFISCGTFVSIRKDLTSPVAQSASTNALIPSASLLKKEGILCAKRTIEAVLDGDELRKNPQNRKPIREGLNIPVRLTWTLLEDTHRTSSPAKCRDLLNKVSAISPKTCYEASVNFSFEILDKRRNVVGAQPYTIPMKCLFTNDINTSTHKRRAVYSNCYKVVNNNAVGPLVSGPALFVPPTTPMLSLAYRGFDYEKYPKSSAKIAFAPFVRAAFMISDMDDEASEKCTVLK